MGTTFQTLILVLSVFGLLSPTEGVLKCFQCTYWGDGGDMLCQNPPENLVQECPDKYKCMLDIAMDQGKKYINRKCIFVSTQGTEVDGCKKQRVINQDFSTLTYEGERCICSSDKCNGAQALMQNWGKLPILVLAASTMLIPKIKF